MKEKTEFCFVLCKLQKWCMFDLTEFVLIDVYFYSAWCNEMTAIITTDDLAKDVGGAEAQINLHKEHRKEIDTRAKDFSRFTQTGKNLISKGHFLSDEVGVFGQCLEI